MQVRISKPTKSAMQSGHGRGKWLLEFINQKADSKLKETLMGRVSSSDMSSEMKLFFPSLEDAINFAEKKHYSYEVIPPKEPNTPKKSYASNFC
jgi:hypothetical protein